MPADPRVGGVSSATSDKLVPNYPRWRRRAAAPCPCARQGFSAWVTRFRTRVGAVLVLLQIGSEDPHTSGHECCRFLLTPGSEKAGMHHGRVPLPAQRSGPPSSSGTEDSGSDWEEASGVRLVDLHRSSFLVGPAPNRGLAVSGRPPHPTPNPGKL